MEATVESPTAMDDPVATEAQDPVLTTPAMLLV